MLTSNKKNVYFNLQAHDLESYLSAFRSYAQRLLRDDDLEVEFVPDDPDDELAEAGTLTVYHTRRIGKEKATRLMAFLEGLTAI